MQLDFLSDVELFYSTHINDDSIIIDGEELHHIIDVMRHKIGDEIYITNGYGSIYYTSIQAFNHKTVSCKILSVKHYENKFSNITFCIPRLKSTDRFEFALEKCVELGITKFIVFDSKRTVAKGDKIGRWENILLAAMKQSLRAWLPKIKYLKSVDEIYKLSGKKILFDQHAEQTFQQFLSANSQKLIADSYYFLFGPEGGFCNDELRIENGELRIRLTENRLRSETAIIATAVELSLKSIQ